MAVVGVVTPLRSVLRVVVAVLRPPHPWLCLCLRGLCVPPGHALSRGSRVVVVVESTATATRGTVRAPPLRRVLLLVVLGC